MKILTSADILLFVSSFCAILVVTLALHQLHRLSLVPVFYARKVLHIFAIGTSGWVIYHAEARMFLAAIFLLACVILFIVSHRRLLFHEEQTSYGIAFFALALGLLLLSSVSTEAIYYGALVTACCDPVAGWAGMRWGNPGRIFLFEKKSWPGFLGFYIACLAITFFFTGLTPQLFVLALVPALTELFSWRGSDNLAVPVLSATWFTLMQQNQPVQDWVYLIVVLGLGMGSVLRRRWLTPEGAAAAVWVGVVIFAAGAWTWLAPIALFFLAGSLSSRWLGRKKEAGGRNAVQVFSNGLVASCCALMYGLYAEHVWLLAFLVSVGVSLADTLSSDLGVKMRQQPYDIITWRQVPVGLSGGITLAGSLAGAAGAIMMALCGGLLFALSAKEIAVIFLLSQAGMFVDSALGSLLQAKYRNAEGVIAEEQNSGMILHRGFRYINNDGVNLLANIIVVFFVIILYI